MRVERRMLRLEFDDTEADVADSTFEGRLER